MIAFEIWHIWMIACLLFFILEVFIPSFIMASIGIGCLLSFLVSLFGAGFPLQIILFSGGTIAGFAGVKPVMQKYMYTKTSIRTNYDGLIGRTGKVTETIDPAKDSGCVAIDGDLWKAIPENNEVIETGTKVKVVQLDSIVVTVISLGNRNPGKKANNILPETVPESKTETTNSLIVGIGTKKHQINYDDIVCFYSNSKTTFLVTKNEKEFIHDESLEKLSLVVPKKRFFRVNRQFIVCRDIISTYKADEYGKIELGLKVFNGLPSNISVSRLKAHAFRAWMKKHK
jgi:membrane protein implicated in regulation of membrane protease activity